MPKSANFIVIYRDKDTPSLVEVPLPISSIRIKELLVAFDKTCTTSFISTIKVDNPSAGISLLPILA